MAIHHQTLRRMTYFAAIAEAGSIRGAAQRLGLSVPVLSEALTTLEAELGVSLATRTTRKFALTSAGREAYDAAREVVEIAERLTSLVDTTRPLSGLLTMTLPVELAGFWLAAPLAQFKANHPDVQCDIHVTDTVVDLKAGAIELAIRTAYVAPGGTPQSALNIPLTVVSAPPLSVDVEGYVDGILIDGDLDRQLMAVTPYDGKHLPLRFRETMRVTNRIAALTLARSGLGAAMVMRASVADELSRGTLHALLPEHDFGSVDIYVQFRDRMPSRQARTFATALNLTARP